MSRFRFSTEANYDVEEISSYISDLDPTAAHRFLDALDETCDLLAEHPGLGRLRTDLGEALRSFPVGNYLVFYTNTREGIDVVRIIYGGRNLPEAFRQP